MSSREQQVQAEIERLQRVGIFQQFDKGVLLPYRQIERTAPLVLEQQSDSEYFDALQALAAHDSDAQQQIAASSNATNSTLPSSSSSSLSAPRRAVERAARHAKQGGGSYSPNVSARNNNSNNNSNSSSGARGHRSSGSKVRSTLGSAVASPESAAVAVVSQSAETVDSVTSQHQHQHQQAHEQSGGAVVRLPGAHLNRKLLLKRTSSLERLQIVDGLTNENKLNRVVEYSDVVVDYDAMPPPPPPLDPAVAAATFNDDNDDNSADDQPMRSPRNDSRDPSDWSTASLAGSGTTGGSSPAARSSGSPVVARVRARSGSGNTRRRTNSNSSQRSRSPAGTVVETPAAQLAAAALEVGGSPSGSMRVDDSGVLRFELNFERLSYHDRYLKTSAAGATSRRSRSQHRRSPDRGRSRSPRRAASAHPHSPRSGGAHSPRSGGGTHSPRARSPRARSPNSVRSPRARSPQPHSPRAKSPRGKSPRARASAALAAPSSPRGEQRAKSPRTPHKSPRSRGTRPRSGSTSQAVAAGDAATAAPVVDPVVAGTQAARAALAAVSGGAQIAVQTRPRSMSGVAGGASRAHDRKPRGGPMSTSDRVAKPGARPRPTEQRYSLPPHFDTLDRYNQTMPLPPPPLPVREGDAGVPPPPESPLPSPPESPRVIRLFEPSTPRERAQYTLLLGEDDVANDDDDGDDNNASGSKDVGESSDSEDESERRARDFASHKHGTLRSAVRKFSSAALVVMPINDAAMDDAISQSEAPQLSKPGAPRGMAPQPPAELVLERNKRAAKLAHVLSVSPSASSPVMRRRSARNKGPSFPAGELGDAELIVAARNEKLRRIFGDSFPAVQTAAVNAGATTAGAAATSSGGATSPKAAADTTPPLTPVTAPSIAPIDGAKLVEALPALMAQLAAPICGKARGFWREAGASVAAARIGGGVEGATTLADLLMAVADEIEELPLVYEYGVDFYSKMFADREHIAFVGQVESANADKSVPASTEPILVCVNTTPVPTDEAEQWYQTIGCGRWGLPLHAAGHAASLNTVRADGSSVLQPPPQPSAGGDDSLAASTRESVRIESRHSVLLAQTQSDVVKEVVAHAAQSRNPFATDTAAVAAAAAVVVDSVPSLTLAPPPASPPLSSSPSSTLNKSELNWRLSGDVPSLSPVSPKRNTSVALASSPSSGGSGEQADYRILVWYRTGNKELLIRAPAPRGRHRSTPPAKDFQRCVVQALDALWNGREQAEVRELDEARDEEFVVPLLDGLKRLGLAQALRDEQVSAHLERALKMSHAHENLIFWRAVERYRLLAEAQRRVYASTIVREFVCAGARFEVNLPDTMRNALLVEFSVACCEPIETLIDGAALQLLTASGKLEAMQTATTSSSTLTTKAMPVAMFDAAQEEVFGLLDGIVSSLLVTSGGSEALVARVREDRERRRRELLARRVSFNLELASDVPELSVQLRNYEASDPQKPYCFSIGLMYVAAGQTTEAQWFGNQQGSPAFARFLSFMAERIELRGWQGYRGDLDVKTDSTGTHSWFSSVDGVDIMFHVSTELPSGEDEQQQLGKKRRIGNDLGVIIFQDGGSFVPPIVSQLLHVYTVVSPVEIDGREFYRVEMSQKAGVEMCSPPLDAPYSLYPATPAFKRLLTYKIVNAQLAAMRSPFLSRKIFEPSKRALLEELVKRFGPPDRPGLIKRMGSIYQFFDEPASPRLASPRRNSLRDSLKRAMSRSKRSNTTDSADESSGGAAVAAAAVAAVAAQTTSSAAASSTGAGDDEQRTLVRGGPSKQASKLGQSTRAADHDDEKQL